MFARYILFFSALCIAVLSWSQHHSAFYSINPDRVNDVTEKHGCKAFSIEWDNPANEIKEEPYHFVLRPPASFTAFGAGISTLTPGVSPLDFSVDYRTLNSDAEWSNWKTAMVETTPEETPTGMFWTELMFTAGETPELALELRIHTSSKVTPASIRLELMDITSAERKFEPAEKSGMRPGGCPPFPTVIDRSVWLEPYYGTQSYTPTVIYPTHCVVHHGASPDTYTDGAAVVRSYWNYHVNTLGWSDIGYNWLFDKYGNIYQGRKNSDMINLDVQGAHAGASNPYSIGVNFLGNADVTTPTVVQLNSLYAFLGWWFDTRGYDPTTFASMVLQSGGTATVPRILGHKDTNIGGTACPGDTLYGYLPIIRIQTKAVIDACMTAPSTAVSTTGNWQTSNFTATFYDTADAGLQMPFYQVLEYQGSEWRANGNSGFFNDNFDNAIHADWTNISGNWSINSGYLNQTNEDSSNTNLYIPLNQQSGNVYLYHFWMRISGSGTNRRAGLHFFCDDPTMIQRNNSYMVYFRPDQDKCQIYKAENDAITLCTDDDCIIDPDTWYDYKIVLNTTTGEISAYINNSLVSSWTDPAPFSSGNSISLRTGNCNVLYNDLKVYRHRNSTAVISVGPSDDARYCNPNPATPACRVKSIILDDNNKWSALEGTDVNIDFTEPGMNGVSDGISSDIDTTFNTTQLSANWQAATEPNSGVSAYWYCIGDNPGGTNIAGWTNNGTNTVVTRTGLALEFDSVYYFTVYAVNGAGITGFPDTSDGQLVKDGSAVGPVASFYALDTLLYLPSASAIFINTSTGATSWLWDFGDGNTSTDQNPWHQYADTGYYTVQLIAFSTTLPDDTLTLQNYIHVLNPVFVDGPETEELLVYPNPFSNQITVSFAHEMNVSGVVLKDVFGRDIALDKKGVGKFTGSISYDLSSIPAGVYTLILSTDNKTYSARLIRQ